MTSSITKLPKELLALIFEYLTEANDRRRVVQVSKLFYEILRHQSTLKHNNVLRMMKKYSVTSPIRVLENSQFFPFAKLHIEHFDNDITMESDFWSLHGHKISEIVIYGKETDAVESYLSACRDYFPNLHKLTIEGDFSVSSDADHSSHTISLPIEDLTLDVYDISLEQILTLLRCCSPRLKNLDITWITADYLPHLLPWLETFENSRLSFNHGFDEMPLERLMILPNKVVIDELKIKFDETPEMIRGFFKNRTIDTLVLYSKGDNMEFDGDGEEIAENPAVVYFNRDQALALGGAKSIKNVRLKRGVLEFEGSLDLLGQLPGLETISLDLDEGTPNPLYPYYWSLPITAQKIDEIVCNYDSNLHYLAGLSGVTSITILDSGEIRRGLCSDEIQTLIRNCPNLKTLWVSRINAPDADLIGHGNLLPISFLKKLEYLDIESAPNVTLEAFKSAFKFPNLKIFYLSFDYNSSEEKPFNQDVAKLFTLNCPKLEYLDIINCPINLEGFEYLIRHLPYLRRIFIRLPKGKRHSLSKDKVEELQQEFPYISINVVEATSE